MPREGWSVEPITVWRIRTPDGRLIQGGYGNPCHFDSESEAQHVADNWDAYRMPTYAELQAMSDDCLMRRAGL